MPVETMNISKTIKIRLVTCTYFETLYIPKYFKKVVLEENFRMALEWKIFNEKFLKYRRTVLKSIFII